MFLRVLFIYLVYSWLGSLIGWLAGFSGSLGSYSRFKVGSKWEGEIIVIGNYNVSVIRDNIMFFERF